VTSATEIPVNRATFKTDGAPAMLAAAYLATVPLLIGWFLPFVVAGFGAMGFSEQQSGLLVSADMLGYTVGTLAASPFLSKLDWRRASTVLLLAIIAANLIACELAHFPGLFSIRLCAGLASGGLAAIALGACAQGDNPGSTYGLWQTFQAMAAAGAGLALPTLIEIWTARVAFVVIAAIAAAGLLLVRLIPHRANGPPPAVAAGRATASGALGAVSMAIAAIFLFLAATTAVTAFLERIGTGMGIAPRVIGFALSAAGAASLVGGLLATKMGDHRGYLGPTLVGGTLAALAYVAYVIGPIGVSTLVSGTVVYFGAYSYVSAYFMGTLAIADQSGRAVAIGNGALGGGITLGPVLGGWVMEATNSTAVLCWVAAGMTALSCPASTISSVGDFHFFGLRPSSVVHRRAV
jgi:predicted MFS family arabinose efflux permease